MNTASATTDFVLLSPCPLAFWPDNWIHFVDLLQKSCPTLPAKLRPSIWDFYRFRIHPWHFRSYLGLREMALLPEIKTPRTRKMATWTLLRTGACCIWSRTLESLVWYTQTSFCTDAPIKSCSATGNAEDSAKNCRRGWSRNAGGEYAFWDVFSFVLDRYPYGVLYLF